MAFVIARSGRGHKWASAGLPHALLPLEVAQVIPVNGMPRILVVLGLALVALGLLWPLLSRLGLGRLPGDLVYERGNFRFYFPLATLVLVNLVLWLLGRLFGGR